ncbi:MAG TPA: TolC family protein [Leptospiraceae bacterium]|nr:TolC family protein [Leptospiraceae bacterium]HNI96296.1 TolC family protein [Leptospiraceae bacterium]
MKKLRTVFLIFLFAGALNVLVGQAKKKTQEETAEIQNRLKLSMKELVQKAVENSPEIRNTSFELIKTDSGFLKSQSKYSWRFLGNVDSQKSVLPDNISNFFTGTKISQDKYGAGFEKLFQTGTYFKLEASNTRFDSNAFEDPVKNALNGFSALAIPPLYTGAITATLSQDLMKNTFGLQDRNIQKILKNQAEIGKLDLTYKLSNTVVDSLVSYWNYMISDSSVKTMEQLRKNTRNIRDLTAQKTGLGLSEGFEINQWNALLAQSENQLERSKLEKEEARRKLVRVLNLPSDTEFSEITDLVEDLPSDMNYEKDLDYAFTNRTDWKVLGLRKELANLSLENAKDSRLPSVKATAMYSAKSQTLISPQHNFTDGQNGVFTNKYKEMTANIRVTYPLFDQGVYADNRDAKIQEFQVRIQEDDLRKEITDDVRIKHDTVLISHKILLNSKKMKKESQAYYRGLLGSYQAGRFNALAVKNALDSLVQNDLQETQAKINYNINLLRYEVAKNSLLNKFEIDVSRILPKIE